MLLTAGRIATVGVILLTRWSAVAAAEDSDSGIRPPSVQSGAIGVPLTIILSADEAAISSDADSAVRLVLRAERALEHVEVRFWTEGNVAFTEEGSFDRERIEEGEEITLDLPVRYGATGDSSVVIDVAAVIADLEFPFTKSVQFNTYVRADRAFAGMEDLSNLKRRALSYDLQARRITEVEAAVQRRALDTPDTVPGHPIGAWGLGDPEHLGLAVEPVAVPIDELESQVEDPPSGGRALSTNITVFGTVQYRDETGATHPVFGYEVQIRDEDDIGSDIIHQMVTGTDGTYSHTFDFDDPNGPDIFCRFRPRNTLVLVRPLGGGSYENVTATTDDVPSNTVIQHNLTFAATGAGPVGSAHSGMTWIAVYTRDHLNGGTGLPQLPVEFPGEAVGAYYCFLPVQCPNSGTPPLINLDPDDRFDWDVMHHEYGHYVMHRFNFQKNPGGAHAIGDCISNVRGSKDVGTRLAWGEGWPTYFGTSGQFELGLGLVQAPRVGTAVYTDTVNGIGGWSYGLEPNSGAGDDTLGIGEDNEVAVQRILWDMYDSNSDGRDTKSYDDLLLFNTFKNNNVETLSEAWTSVRSSAAIVPNDGADLDVGAITTDHAVGPNPTAPPANAFVAPGTIFNWAEMVGCGALYRGDSFKLNFYDAATRIKVLTVPEFVGASHILTAAEYAALFAAGNQFVWAAEGKDTNNPVTGFYLGANSPVNLLKGAGAGRGFGPFRRVPWIGDKWGYAAAGARTTLGARDVDGWNKSLIWQRPRPPAIPRPGIAGPPAVAFAWSAGGGDISWAFASISAAWDAARSRLDIKPIVFGQNILVHREGHRGRYAARARDPVVLEDWDDTDDLEMSIDFGAGTALPISTEMHEFSYAQMTITGTSDLPGLETLYSATITAGHDGFDTTLDVVFEGNPLLGLDDATVASDISAAMTYDPGEEAYVTGSDTTVVTVSTDVPTGTDTIEIGNETGIIVEVFEPGYTGPPPVGGWCGDGVVDPLRGEQCDPPDGTTCDNDCQIIGDTVAVSAWGMATVALLLLSGIAIKFGRRRAARVVA